MSQTAGLRRAGATASAGTIAAPSALVVNGVFYLMVTGVLGGLWFNAAEASGGTIVGYSAVALVWYIAASEAAFMCLPIRLIADTGDDIGSGRVEVELLRPVSGLWIRIAIQAGAMLPRLALCVVLGLGMARLIGGPVPDAGALLLAAPALLLAASANLIAQHGFAAAAFWIRDTKSTWFIYQKMIFVTGGMLLPIEVFPPWLETVARVLPFSAMAYVPARLASGHREPELLAIQVGWLIVIAVGTTVLYRRGEERLTREGA